MSYIIRNSRGRPLLSFDNEARAREEMARMEKRTGCKFELFQVWQEERKVA